MEKIIGEGKITKQVTLTKIIAEIAIISSEDKSIKLENVEITALKKLNEAQAEKLIEKTFDCMVGGITLIHATEKRELELVEFIKLSKKVEEKEGKLK